MFVLKETLPGKCLAKTLNSAHEATWLVLIWLHLLTIRQSNLFRTAAAPGWVIDTVPFKSCGLRPDPGEPSSASSPHGSPGRVTGSGEQMGWAGRCPFQQYQERTRANGAQTGFFSSRAVRGSKVGGELFQESRLGHRSSAWAHCSRCPPVAAANFPSELQQSSPLRHPLVPAGSGPELRGLLT